MRRARCVFPKCGTPTDGQGYHRYVCEACWTQIPPEEQVRILDLVRFEEEREAAQRAYQEAADNPTFTYAVDQQCFLIDGQSVRLELVKYASEHYTPGESLQVGERVFSRKGMLKMVELADSVSGYHPRT